jgi:type I restriction enzyme R subunit
MPHAYTVDQLVEQPAIALFAELGWKTVRADEVTHGPIGTLQRETKSEVVLTTPRRGALTKLNPTLPTSSLSPWLHPRDTSEPSFSWDEPREPW